MTTPTEVAGPWPKVLVNGARCAGCGKEARGVCMVDAPDAPVLMFPILAPVQDIRRHGQLEMHPFCTPPHLLFDLGPVIHDPEEVIDG